MLRPDRSHLSLTPLIIGFALLLAAAGSAIWLSTQQQEVTDWVRHTLEVENRLSRVLLLATDAESAQRGFLLGGRDTDLAPYEAAKAQLLPEIEALGQQTADNSEQQPRVAALRAAAQGKLADLETTVGLRRGSRLDDPQAFAAIEGGVQTMARIREIVAALRDTEEQLLKERSASAERLNRFVHAALVGSGLLVMVLAFFALRDARIRLLDLQVSKAQLETEIAERTTAEGQVRQLQKMEAVGQLTGGIAHDFNNMLAIVIGSLDMARRRLTGTEHPKVRSSIDNAAEGAQRAATLTARLLAFSRQQPLDPRALDANKLVGGMSELLRRTIGEPVRIETVLAGGLWRCLADPSQVESAVVNLAVNARDAMPDGGQLTIETANSYLDDAYARAHQEVKAGQYVMISVSDTGLGMAPEIIERAFDPFFTTKGVGKGTGLGLSQVFGFVKQSSGHVKIYSETGHGTTIKLYLPRLHSAEVAASAATRSVGALPMGRPGEIIFVVEDEAQVRHVSVEALRELGYTVIQAPGPNEALEQLGAEPNIDLLFTDIVMPAMSGRQLADKALALRPDLKVLFTTGYTRNAVVHNGVLDPGTAFLPKPFSIEQLAVKVREVLDDATQPASVA